MKKNKNLFIYFSHYCATLLLCLGCESTTWASLGGSDTTIETDRAQIAGLNKSAKLSSNGKFTVHEISSNSHVIREYVDSNGIVFGIAWTGNSHPNLTKLLGGYAGEYKTAFEKHRKNHRAVGSRTQSIVGAHVRVDRTGHMRNFRGRAYDSALIPAGVTIDEIK